MGNPSQTLFSLLDKKDRSAKLNSLGVPKSQRRKLLSAIKKAKKASKEESKKLEESEFIKEFRKKGKTSNKNTWPEIKFLTKKKAARGGMQIETHVIPAKGSLISSSAAQDAARVAGL